MRRLLRGHLLSACSSASTGAIALASVNGASEESACILVEQAIHNLVSATVTALESVDFDEGETERRHLYLALKDYISVPKTILRDAPPHGVHG